MISNQDVIDIEEKINMALIDYKLKTIKTSDEICLTVFNHYMHINRWKIKALPHSEGNNTFYFIRTYQRSSVYKYHIGFEGSCVWRVNILPPNEVVYNEYGESNVKSIDISDVDASDFKYAYFDSDKLFFKNRKCGGIFKANV